MRKLFIMSVLIPSITFFSACDSKQQKKEDAGVKIEGKKGGELEINKDKLQIEGKKGGELKMDSNGVKIKDKNHIN